MNRMLLTAVTSSVLAVAAPAVASAHNGKAHHHARHANTRSHHHALRARVLNFGSMTTTSGSGPSTGATGTVPTGPTPASPAGETAGTVTSFTNGVLTITLTGGSVVTGQVTEKTEIHCQPATPATGGEDQGDDEGGSATSGDATSQSGPDVRSHQDGQQGSEGGNGQDNEQGSSNGQQGCTTTPLVPGTVVREAQLSVTSAGAVWDHVDLVQ